MEDEDCYYHCKRQPPLGGCLNQKSAAQNYFNNQKRPLAALNADKWNAYYQSLASKQNNKTKKMLPPVPKFEEITKHAKVDPQQELSSSSSQLNQFFNQDLQKIPGSELNAFCINQGNIQNNNTQAHKVKVIKVIPETQSYEEMFCAGKAKASQKFHQKMLTKQDQYSDEIADLKAHLSNGSPNLSDEEKSTDVSAPQSPEHQQEQQPIIQNPNVIAAALDKKDEKKYNKFLDLFKDYSEQLNLNDEKISNRFQELTRIVIPQLLTHFKSKPFDAVAASILLQACRDAEYPITLKKIVSVANAKEKMINKCIFSLKEILPEEGDVKHFKAGEFILVLAERLNIIEQVKLAAIKIWENIERLNFIKSIHQVTLAACCLKFACALSEGADKDFDAIAGAAGITKMTLKNMYRELFPYRYYFITAECQIGDPKNLKNL